MVLYPCVFKSCNNFKEKKQPQPFTELRLLLAKWDVSSGYIPCEIMIRLIAMINDRCYYPLAYSQLKIFLNLLSVKQKESPLLIVCVFRQLLTEC